jgi:hypothetical protein
MANAFLTIADGFGLGLQSFGDSTARMDLNAAIETTVA